jgi:hypothetical protein
MRATLGGLGRAVLALIGKFSNKEIASNLNRLKGLMGTGRVTDTSYSVAGQARRKPGSACAASVGKDMAGRIAANPLEGHPPA